jgi:RPA family protein
MTNGLQVGGQRERHTSQKLWIREILEGEMQLTNGPEPNTLKTIRGNANRVNILGVVINKEDLPVSSLTVDDGTGQITVRSFEQKLRQPVGVVVQVIGRPRAYQGDLYIAAEAAATVDPGWAEFRKKELGDVQKTDKVEPTPRMAINEENRAERIIQLIKQLDDGSGAPVEQVVTLSKIPEAEAIIEQMLMHGDIFELRPGKLKVL